jgi:thymidylate synthase
MQQYLEILQEVIDHGTIKGPAREGMPSTLSRFGILKRFDLREGFPLLTTKKMFYKGVIHELIWFLKGDTNINYLHKNGVKKMWHEDGYKYYKKVHSKKDTHVRSFEEWCEALDDETYARKFGSLGKIYSYQWRNFTCTTPEGKVFGFDQINEIVKRIKETPTGRYHIVSAWNPGETWMGALPPCHMLFHFNCRPMTVLERFQYWYERDNLENSPSFVAKYGPDESNMKADLEMLEQENIPAYFIDCEMIQRSCDTPLGVPFNIASYALLTMIFGKLTNMVPGDLVWVGNDVHIYEDQMEGVKQQLKRRPKKLPKMNISGNWESIDDIKYEDFELVGYEHHPKIEFKLSTGLR